MRVVRCFVLLSLVLGLSVADCSRAGEPNDIPINFNIPATELKTALEAYSKAASVDLIYTDDTVAGLKSNPVVGSIKKTDALNMLLNGLNLTTQASGQSIAITKSTAPVSAAKTPGSDPLAPTVMLEEVTVLGTRQTEATPLSKVPASITIVDQEEIEKELPTASRIEDLIRRQVPGFNPTNQGVRQIRGRTAQIFINGVPANEQLRASSGSDLNLVMMEQLAQIEVNRGPNAAYGFGSAGGIIGLSTPRATSRDLSFKSTVSESFNPQHIGGSHQAIAYLSASQIVNDFDFHVGLAGSYDGAEYDRDGDLALGFSNSALLTNSKEALVSFDTSLGYDFKEAGKIRLSATANYVDFLERYRVDGGAYRKDYANIVEVPDGDKSSRLGYTINLSYENEDFMGHAIKAEGFTSDTYTEVFSGTPLGRDEQDNEYYGFRTSATKVLPVSGRFEGMSITYGFDYFLNEYSRPLFNDDTGALIQWFAPPVSIMSYAPHMQLQIPFGERLLLSTGIRYELYEGSAETAVGAGGTQGGDIEGFDLTLANAGMVYHINKDIGWEKPLDLFINFSQGAEVSQIGRAARNAGRAELIRPEPATSNQYEMGFRGSFQSLTFNVSGYYSESDLSSALQRDPADPDGPLVPLREPREFWGIEASADYKLNEQWDFGVIMSWQEGTRETATGKRDVNSREVPPVLVTANVDYSPFKWWRNRVQVDYRGERDKFSGAGFDEGRVDSLTLVNLSMSFQVGPGQLFVGAENVFNQKYTSIPAEAANGSFLWAPEEGTRVKIGYTVKW